MTAKDLEYDDGVDPGQFEEGDYAYWRKDWLETAAKRYKESEK